MLLQRAWLSAVFAVAARTSSLGVDACSGRPAVVLCDGYEDLVVRGPDDVGADLQAFAHGWRHGLFPVIVSRSASALSQALGGARCADRVLGQLRSRVFLDAASQVDPRLAARRFGSIRDVAGSSASGVPFSGLGPRQAVVDLGGTSAGGPAIRIDALAEVTDLN